MKTYLFRNSHNGHYSSYQPFYINKDLSQEDASKFMLIKNPSAGRTGSNLNDLIEVAYDHGYEIKPFKNHYRLQDEPSTLDPLPMEFYEYPVIDGICGNY